MSSLRWRGADRCAHHNALASGFPNLQFNSDDVESGAIKVYARSPSGRTQLLDVINVDGNYNANFTPDEIGDWTVSILQDCKNIEGSPFKVRVYDPGMIRVIGLDAGLACRNYTFSIDASSAGQGALTIDITHNGQIIPAQISADATNHKLFNVHFTPQGNGYYTVRVFFAEVEVTGSPFTVELNDGSSITASGAGLTSGQVQQRAIFIINTGQGGISTADLKVTITDASGMQIPANVIDQRDGTLRVEFVPLTVGNQKIDILYCSKPVAGSPHFCKVSDCNQIKVTNLTSATCVGRTVEFDIDASQAGPGDLEIMVNGGSVPCTIKPTGQRRYHGSFVARSAVPHDIEVFFNKQPISGSPWRVDVINASQVTVSGEGLELVPVGTPAYFEVRGAVACCDGDLVINITAPSKRSVRSTSTKLPNGVYRVEYTPTEVGVYAIEVIYDCTSVPGSPFACRAYDVSLVECSKISLGFVDKPIEFTVDASRAGEGQLEIMVNRGSVPNSARPVGKGIFAVSFTPTEPRLHIVEVTFNGEQTKCGIQSVPVIDLCQITVQAPVRCVPVNRPVGVRVGTLTAGEAELTASVTSPSGASVPCRVTGSGGKGYDVEFTPMEAGLYLLDLKYAGLQVSSTATKIKAYDVSKLKVIDLHDGIVGQETMFKVDSTNAGEGDLEVTITSPSGAAVSSYIRQQSAEIHGVFFTPQQSGVHVITMAFNGEIVPGSPFRVNVIDPGKALARGDGLDIVQCNQTATFFVSAPSAQLKDFDIRIIGPNSKDVMYRTSDAGTGTFKVDYIPVLPGEYRIEISYFGQSIAGSAFTAKAWDINKVSVSNISTGRVAVQSSFNINVKDAGEGTLEIGITGPSGQNISNNVSALGPGHFLVSYIPLESGPHRANVTFNGESVNGNPFAFAVNDPGRVSARGDGLGFVRCNQPTSFTITAPGAQLKDLDVRVTGPNGRDVSVRLTENGPNTFKATYTPVLAGEYSVEVVCFDQSITGSPFTVQASDLSRVIVSNITTGVVGQQATFSIDVRNAGEGTLEIGITGPSGLNVSNNVTAQGPGVFLVAFVPTESGQHRANITFNKDSVIGNPFTFMVIDPLKVTARGDGLGLVRCGQSTSFVVTAPAAEQSDLEVTITGANGKQILPRINDGANNSFRVDYTPLCAGDQPIEIFYFGQPIPGSPFTAKVWDSSKVVVAQITAGRVGVQSAFAIDVKGAGEGTLEIGICGPSGQNIPNNVMSLGASQFEVTFVPVDSGLHRANITFNKENVTGTPFQFLVTDLNRVSARGDGLGLIKCNQLTSFIVTAPAAQLKDLDVCITGPSDKLVVARATDQGSGQFKYEYTPTVAGDYKIDVSYFDQPLPLCPFIAKAWDPSKVVVNNVSNGRVGCQSTFNIDAREAGDGSLEIGITGPSGRNIQNNVATLGPGLFEITYLPADCGLHYISVTFNKENVPGSRFQLMVTDPSRTAVRGDGLGLVRCQQLTSFMILAPGAQTSDLNASIIGPDGKDVLVRLIESGNPGTFLAEYTPSTVGDYQISVTYFGEVICGCPYYAKAWDASTILVTGIKPGCIGKQSTFNVNVANAGEGNLEVIVTSSGEVIPSTVKCVGNGCHSVTFTPQSSDVYSVLVRFNCEMAPGSPFSIPVLDGRKATASGDGLGTCIIANKPTSFDVNTKLVCGDAPLDVNITSPRGQQVRCKLTGSPSAGFHVEYVPTEAGRYVVDVKYAEMPITGNPFYPEVVDPSQVRVGAMPQGILGKPFTFDIDTTMAGDGRLAVDVRAQLTRPLVNLAPKAEGLYTVTFVPQECCSHTVLITFCGLPVTGSPFFCNVIDVANICVDWNAIRLKPVHCPVVVVLDPMSSPDAEVTCAVSDPTGHKVQTRLSKSGRIIKVEFVGHMVGQYHIDLTYGGVSVPGSPFTCNMYDVSKVRITDASTTGNVGQQATFTVDTSEAGFGDLDVQVTCKDDRIPTQVQQLSSTRQRFTYVPMSPFNHIVTVKYNNDDVPGSPMMLRVINPASQMLVSCSGMARTLPVGHAAVAIIQTQNIAINLADLTVNATAANGEALMVRLLPQQDNTIKVEYTSRVSGITSLLVQYACQPIPGCPVTAEFFDPCKVLIEGCPAGLVGEPMILDALTKDAGKAELSVTIRDSKGLNVPFDMKPSPQGFQISYTPREPGTYAILMNYGGMDIPGCPVYQQIEDNTLPTVCGDGLQAAIENCPANFMVTTNGRPGDLTVIVQGPNSMSRCTIEPIAVGQFKVTYTPVEVGVFSIVIKWNGREIPGCPYRPAVINADKLSVVGGWVALFDGADKMKLRLNEMKLIEFDSSQAGPGQMSARVTGPDGNEVITNVIQRDINRWVLSFTPLTIGDYLLNVCWAGIQLKRCPVIGNAIDGCPPPPEPIRTRPENVVLIGPGLTNARVKEEAEFIIDGSSAGPGTPSVKLMGIKQDINVSCTSIGDNRYKCCYTPDIPGAYLLSIAWSDYQVPGSPFKVSVNSGTDASKVTCTGEGLNGGSLGQELRIVVDSRRAGPGELLASCQGPTKPAFCQLEDQQDGTFILKIKPQEVGTHQLRVTFAGEQIQGSPFAIRVTSATDASKVRVSGPGILSGILATFESSFLVETSGAGPGRLTVRVRGPKGAFRVEMTPDQTRDRAILCRYNPTEVGQYILQVKWSGDNVPGSPFPVTIVDTRQELEMLRSNNLTNGNSTYGGGLGNSAYNGGGGSSVFRAPDGVYGYGGGSGGGNNEPIYIEGSDAGSVYNGTLRMSTLSGDGQLIFNDDY